MPLRNALKIVSHTQPDRRHPVCIAVACMAMTAFLSACGTPGPEAPVAPSSVVAEYPFPQDAPCAGIVAGSLQDTGLQPADVRLIEYSRREMINGRGATRFLGWDAWTRLNGRDGALVMRIDTICRIEEAYTRNGLSIEGLKAY